MQIKTLIDARREIALASFHVNALGDGSQLWADRLANAQRTFLEIQEAARLTASPGTLEGVGGAKFLPPDTSAWLTSATTGIRSKICVQLDPLPTGFAHLMEPASHPLVVIDLENTGDRWARLRVSTWIDGYSATHVESVEIVGKADAQDDQARKVRMTHLPTLFPERISGLREATRATVRVRIEHLEDGRVERECSKSVVLLPRTTLPEWVVNVSGTKVDRRDWYAAWVTQNDPEVRLVLREAASGHEADFVGYQVSDGTKVEEAVCAQVKAVYNALKARKITYVNSTMVSGTADIGTQRVRLPREALESRSANCLDGTLLFASVLEAASLCTGIVIAPEHAYLAWIPSGNWGAIDKWGDWRYLETTWLQTHTFEEAMEEGKRKAERDKALGATVGWTIVNVRYQHAHQNVLPLD